MNNLNPFFLIVFLFTLLLIESSQASGVESAARKPNVSGATMAARYMRTQVRTLSGSSAYDKKQSPQAADLSKVPMVDPLVLQQVFTELRDNRFFHDFDGTKNPMDRRASWLYPDDGCFTRAVVAAEVTNSKFGVKPAKVFAFGDLDVKTSNHPNGSVQWWYHVAAIVKSGSETYVLDPALDYTKPTLLADWLLQMTDPKIETAICNGDTYVPSSDCDTANSSTVQEARTDAPDYLAEEWKRLVLLGRDPVKEL